MEIYLCILIAFLVLGAIKATGEAHLKKSDNTVLFLSCCILFLFAAMRAVTVGADTRQYEWVFQWVQSLKFSQLGKVTTSVWFSQNQDWGYLIYNKVLSLIFTDSHAITIVNSGLLIAGLTLLIKRCSPDKWLSVFLFFTLGLYQLALNLTPSTISLLFMSAMTPYAEKKKPIPYFSVLIILAIFIHMSAVAFIPVYFILQKRITCSLFLSVFVFCVGMSLVYRKLIPFFMIILPTSYRRYLGEETGIFEQLAVIGVHVCLVGICWLCYRNKKKFWDYNQSGLWFLLLESTFYILAIQNTMFSRAAFLFSNYIIVTIPQMLNCAMLPIKTEMNTTTSTFVSKYIVRKSFRNIKLNVCYIGCIFFPMIMYLVRIYVNNIGKTMPYEFF